MDTLFGIDKAIKSSFLHSYPSFFSNALKTITVISLDNFGMLEAN